jgi:hypothetical protein
MAEEFKLIEDLAREIKNKFDASATSKKKILALYAFNSTGKTRLTNIFTEINERSEEDGGPKVLCYNALLEDLFGWDNEENILNFDLNSWVAKLIEEQGLENEIIDNFREIIHSKIEPLFDFEKGAVSFNFVSGDDSSETNIKISRGEESVFIWSIFYTIFKTAIESFNTDKSNRTTAYFNNLEYIVIDDPISSIDDTKIIAMALKLIETADSLKNNSLKFFITTHHALFYNVLVNSFSRNKKCNFKSYNLFKNNQILKLSKQGDSPFAYHLSIKETIQKAIGSNSIERYHFNLFRNLLEKTSNFLGYNNWADCISENKRRDFIKLLNLYSHSRLSELESRELFNEDKILFQEVFDDFIKNFKWK